jgi:hypothetical protein
MIKKKISPKVQQAVEKYLGSLGFSRTDLTDKQWEIITNYVKTQRMKVPILLVFGVVSACLGFLYFQHAKSYIDYAALDEVIFISKAGKEPFISLKPDDIKKCFDYFTHGYFMAGFIFAGSVFCFTSIFILIPLTRRENKRMFKAFIPCKQEPENILSMKSSII